MPNSKHTDYFKATSSIYDCCEQSKVSNTPEGQMWLAVIATAIYDVLPRKLLCSPHRLDALGWLFDDDQNDNPEPRSQSFRWVTELIFEDSGGFREKIRAMLIEKDQNTLGYGSQSKGVQRRLRGRVGRATKL